MQLFWSEKTMPILLHASLQIERQQRIYESDISIMVLWIEFMLNIRFKAFKQKFPSVLSGKHAKVKISICATKCLIKS